MQNLLITFGTRPLAQRLSKMLNTNFNILFASSEEVPSFLASNYHKIPTGVNPTFAHEVLKLAMDQQIDFILPLGLSEMQALTEAKILFEEYGIQLLTPDQERLLEIFVLENPSSSVELVLSHHGKNLLNSKDLPTQESGLFALSDDGLDIALCSI